MQLGAERRAAGAFLLAVLLFLSGLGSLVLQVGWMREFRLIFGASTAASAAVVAIFMGGLGIGSALWGTRVDRLRNPLRFYALLELGVFLSAAASPWTIGLVRSMYIAVGGQSALGLVGATAARLAGAAAVLAIPTVLMGGTLPAAVRAVTGQQDHQRRGTAVLYAFNTLGAVAGAAGAAFWLLPTLGTRHTLWAASLVELAVSAGAWFLSRRLHIEAAAPEPEQVTVQLLSRQERSKSESPNVTTIPHALIYMAAAVVGFAFFLMELVWYRMLGPILGGTTYTFGLLLAIALLGIGIGSACYPVIFRRRRPTLGAFALTCGLEAVLIAVPFALGDRLAVQSAVWAEQSDSFLGSVMDWASIAGVVVFPTALIAGLQYPILVALLGQGRQQIGRQVGLCGAWNTAGAIAGSLAGGFGVLPLLSAPGAWRLVVVVLALTGTAAAVQAARQAAGGSLVQWRQLRPLALPVAAATISLMLLLADGPTAVWRHSGIGAKRFNLPAERTPNAWRDWMHSRRRYVVWQADGVEASIGLVADNSLAFFVNGKSDGDALGDAGTQIMLGLLPAFLHGQPSRALVVGLGTGESAGWLAEVGSIERVDVVELEPAVDEMARCCAAVNFNVLEHSKVHRVYNDAREVLLTGRERYDIIASEPSNPYRAGVANLFTQEFYTACRNRLAADGLFVQWLQGYEVDLQTVHVVLSTLRSVFPAVEVWQSQGGDLLLVCGSQPMVLDLATLRARLEVRPFRSGVAYAWRATDLEGVLARYIAGPTLLDHWTPDTPWPPNTDDHNLVEYGFARTLGKHTDFSIDGLSELAREAHADRPAHVGGEANWELVEDHKQVFRNLWFNDTHLSPDATTHRGTRARVLRAYNSGDPASMTRLWESAGYEPVFPTEVALLALGYADQGDARGLPLLERLRDYFPVEAAAIEVHLLWRQGQFDRAREQLEKMLQMLQQHPWGLSHTVELALLVAEDIARRDRQVAPRLYTALSQPFAAYAYNNERLTALLGVAYAINGAAVVETIQMLEPWVPWTRSFLDARYQAYRSVSHPLTRRARADLDAFQHAATAGSR